MAVLTRPGVALALVLALEALLYAGGLQHAFVIDDAVYIAENPAVTRGAPWASYFLDASTIASEPELQWQAYRPLRTLAFRAVAVVAGVEPWAYAAANLVLYAVATGLLLLLLRRAGAPPGAAAWATALWGLAPVHVEAVLYASALGDQLSLVLQLAALLLSMRVLAGARHAPTLATAACGLAAAAMLTKEMAVTTPALVLAWAWLSGDGRARPRRALALVAAHGLVAVLFLVARTLVLGAVGHGPMSAGVVGNGLAWLPARLGGYLAISVAPLGHDPAYGLAPRSASTLALSWLALLAGLACLWRLLPRLRLAASWFALSLLPVLGIVPIYAHLADRYALLPSVGLALAAATGLAWLAPRARLLATVAPALLLAAYAIGTLAEQPAWADDVTLAEKAARLDPGSALAQHNLGLARLQQGRTAEALGHFEAARALGEVSGELEYRRAVALDELGRTGEAEAVAAQAVTLRPRSGRTHALYGGLLLRRGRLEDAERELALARGLEPDHPSVRMLDVEAAAARGDAVRERAAAAALSARFPGEPRFHFLYARTLLRLGDAPAAESAARACLRLAPARPECLCLVARALVAAGKSDPQTQRALAEALPALAPGPERTACEDALRALR